MDTTRSLLAFVTLCVYAVSETTVKIFPEQLDYYLPATSKLKLECVCTHHTDFDGSYFYKDDTRISFDNSAFQVYNVDVMYCGFKLTCPLDLHLSRVTYIVTIKKVVQSGDVMTTLILSKVNVTVGDSGRYSCSMGVLPTKPQIDVHVFQGDLQITSPAYGKIQETYLNFLVVNVTTNIDTIPAPALGQRNSVTFRVIGQYPKTDHDAFVFWTNTSGELRNRVMFDYETEPRYFVVIEAVPRFGLIATQNVTIDVLDDNESQTWTYPRIGSYYTANLKDGYRNTNETELLTVKCRDQDIGQTLSYSLDDPRHMFDIDANGTIRLADDVIVKRGKFAATNYIYIFKVIAMDDGYPPISSTGEVRVTIGVNDDDGVLDVANSTKGSLGLVTLLLALILPMISY